MRDDHKNSRILTRQGLVKQVSQVLGFKQTDCPAHPLHGFLYRIGRKLYLQLLLRNNNFYSGMFFFSATLLHYLSRIRHYPILPKQSCQISDPRHEQEEREPNISPS